MPGYSGTPLAKKLGIRSGARVLAIHPPEDYRALLGDLPDDVSFTDSLNDGPDLVHVFVTRRADLATRLTTLRARVDPATAVWVSWPKKAAKVPTDVTEDVIRDVALPMGFVDIKVCAVSDVWSGLKLVVRKVLR